MAWTLTGDLGEYLAAAGGFLRSEPVRHTVELTAAETLQARGMAAFGSPGALFGWWRPGNGPVTATLFHTPPYPMLLTPLPPGAAPPLARALLARGHDPLGVAAEQRDAARFAAAWAELTGSSARVVRRSRLFRLGTLTPLRPAARGRPGGHRGRPRPAHAPGWRTSPPRPATRQGRCPAQSTTSSATAG